VYAETDDGKPIYCDACERTGQIPGLTDFEALLKSCVTEKGEVESTAVLVLCDYLQEHDDPRHTRLRKRLRWYENAVASWELNRDALTDYRGHTYCDDMVNGERRMLGSYIRRLFSVGYDDPLPRFAPDPLLRPLEPGTQFKIEPIPQAREEEIIRMLDDALGDDNSQ
jgi:hypothetical protein